jgi:hypothetical protein
MNDKDRRISLSVEHDETSGLVLVTVIDLSRDMALTQSGWVSVSDDVPSLLACSKSLLLLKGVQYENKVSPAPAAEAQPPMIVIWPSPFEMGDITAWPDIAKACEALPGKRWTIQCEDADKRYRIGLKSGEHLAATGVYTPPAEGQEWLHIGDVSVTCGSVEYVRPA